MTQKYDTNRVFSAPLHSCTTVVSHWSLCSSEFVLFNTNAVFNSQIFFYPLLRCFLNCHWAFFLHLGWSLECPHCVCLCRCGWLILSTLGSTHALCMPVLLASAPTCASAVCPVGFCTTTSESSTWRYCGRQTHWCLFALVIIIQHALWPSNLSQFVNSDRLLSPLFFPPSFLLLSISSVNVAVRLCPCLASCYGGSSSTQLLPTTQTLTAWRETPSVSRWAFASLKRRGSHLTARKLVNTKFKQ